MLRSIATSCVLFLLMASVALAQDDGREVFETKIDADVAVVWEAFTTTKGLQSWVAPNADIEMKLGGKWRANYNEDGKLGDENTIENTILAFDPQRMLSLKATGFPKGFPFEEAAAKSWSVFYFKDLGPGKTQLTVVGLGYDETEQSKKMRAFFEQANKYSIDQLKAALAKKQSRMTDKPKADGGVKGEGKAKGEGKLKPEGKTSD